VNVVDAAPIRADGCCAGRCSRRSRHWARQDAGSWRKTLEDNAIQLAGEGIQLILEVINGAELGGEIRDGGVDAGLPRAVIGGGLLDDAEAVGDGGLQAVDARFDQSEAVAQLLHLVKEELGTRIHGAQGLLQAGVVVMGIQTGGAGLSL